MFLYETRYRAGDRNRIDYEMASAAIADYRVYADRPVPLGTAVSIDSFSNDFGITMEVVDLIGLCLDLHSSDGKSYLLRVATLNGRVSVVGSTDSQALRDACRKCLIRAKAEIAGIADINDVGVVHASDPRPERGEGLMDSTAKYVDLRLRSILSPTCVIRVDHVDNVIFIRGSVLYLEDYEIVSTFKEHLPNQWEQIHSVDISGVLCSGFNKPLPK